MQHAIAYYIEEIGVIKLCTDNCNFRSFGAVKLCEKDTAQELIDYLMTPDTKQSIKDTISKSDCWAEIYLDVQFIDDIKGSNVLRGIEPYITIGVDK